MKLLPLCFALAASSTGVAAQPVGPSEPVTVEHYYRIKWGSAGGFKRLYKLNHEPLLIEMQKLGFMRSLRTDVPFTYMAGDHAGICE